MDNLQTGGPCCGSHGSPGWVDRAGRGKRPLDLDDIAAVELPPSMKKTPKSGVTSPYWSKSSTEEAPSKLILPFFSASLASA